MRPSRSKPTERRRGSFWRRPPRIAHLQYAASRYRSAAGVLRASVPVWPERTTGAPARRAGERPPAPVPAMSSQASVHGAVPAVSQPEGSRSQGRSVGVIRLRRAAAVRVRRGRPAPGRTASWRSGRAGRVGVGGRWCARQTGGGQPVEVRRKEGVTDHLHPESCVGRCEAAGEALTGARTDGAIEHRKQRVLERRDCHRGRRPHRHSRDG